MAIWGIVVNTVIRNVSQLFKKKEDREYGLGMGDYKHMVTVRNGIGDANGKPTVIEELSENAKEDLRNARIGAKNYSGMGNSIGISFAKSVKTPVSFSSKTFAVSDLFDKGLSSSFDSGPDPSRAMIVVAGVVLTVIVFVYANAK